MTWAGNRLHEGRFFQNDMAINAVKIYVDDVNENEVIFFRQDHRMSMIYI